MKKVIFDGENVFWWAQYIVDEEKFFDGVNLFLIEKFIVFHV